MILRFKVTQICLTRNLAIQICFSVFLSGRGAYGRASIPIDPLEHDLKDQAQTEIIGRDG